MTEKETQKLLIEYRDVINKLKKLGIVRTGKVVADYGEYIASKKLGLTLMSSSVNKGYDATDKNGKKYEIKARKDTAWNKATVFNLKKEQLELFDFLIYVGFDDNWNVVKMLKIPSLEVKTKASGKVTITKELVSKYNKL